MSFLPGLQLLTHGGHRELTLTLQGLDLEIKGLLRKGFLFHGLGSRV